VTIPIKDLFTSTDLKSVNQVQGIKFEFHPSDEHWEGKNTIIRSTPNGWFILTLKSKSMNKLNEFIISNFCYTNKQELMTYLLNPINKLLS